MTIKRKLILCFLLTFALFAAGAIIGGKVLAADWYNEDWFFRKQITINSSQVPGNLANFPVLINKTDLNWRDTANGGVVGQSDGGDILFTSSDGTTKLDHEIESYNSATGELVAWVEVPAVSSSVDTVIYMYYGNAGAADQWNINGTWDEEGSNYYAGVWHLKESSGSLTDSTGNVNGTRNGTSATTGKIANGQLFNTSESDHIDLGINYIFQYDDKFTVSAWVKMSTTGSTKMVAARDNGDMGWRILLTSAGQLRFALVANAYDNWFMYVTSDVEITDTTNWHHIAVIYPGDGNPNNVELYIDGVQTTPAIIGPGVDHDYTGIDSYKAGIGANDDNTDGFFDGNIDELRIATGATLNRTAAWFQASYNNQNDPSSFLTFGLQAISIPTMTEWGMIIFMVLAGLGSIYYLRRKRIES